MKYNIEKYNRDLEKEYIRDIVFFIFTLIGISIFLELVFEVCMIIANRPNIFNL